MRYLLTNFTSATQPALTPIPFDSVTEGDATVDVAYGASVGYLGGAGMKVNWTGSPATSNVGYGRKLFSTSTDHFFVNGIGGLLDDSRAQNHVRVRMAIRFPTTTGFATNDRIKILRFNYVNSAGTITEAASVSWVKRAGTAFRLRVDNAISSTSATSSDIDKGDYNTYFFLNVDLIRSRGCAFINVGEAWPYTTATQLAAGTVAPNSSTQSFTRLAFATTIAVPTITSVDMGSITIVDNGGSNKNPSASSEMNISDVWIGDDVYPEGYEENGVCGNYEIDNAAVRLNYSYFADFGAITPNLGGYETFPAVQMAIVPNAVYRISATFAENPPGEPLTGNIGSGYTSIQAYQHSSEAFTFVSPEYTCRFPIGGQTSYMLKTLPTQNAIRIYSGEWTNAEFFIQRMR